MFSLCVGAAMKIMAKNNIPDDDKHDEVEVVAPSSEMKIVDVESK